VVDSSGQAEVATPKTSAGLFVRNATGLVRGVPPRSGLIMNFIPGHPTQTLAAVLFFALALNPGGNFFLSIALVLPMTLAFAYAFGLLTQMIPRSGGDYMLVSRVLTPAWGLVSSFCMTMALLLSNAYLALAFVTVGLGPGLTGVGLIAGSNTLVSWGATVSVSKGWELGLGLAMFAFAGLVQLGGWRRLLRVQAVLFWMVTGSLLVCGIIALFMSHGSFISSFNSFARPHTHLANTYAAVIAGGVKAGINVSPAFSFAHTIPVIGILATTAVYSYYTAFVGGELRQASTVKTSNMMALGGVIPLVLVFIFGVIFFHTFGGAFLRAANGGGMPSQIAVTNTPFFFLVAAALNNTVFAVVVFLCYIGFWPLLAYLNTLQQTRMLFAYSFDGILPKRVTRLNGSGCPYIALGIALLASAGVLVWAVYVSTFFQVLAYATLIQLIAMMSVGVAAVVVPARRPELFRASTSQIRLLGIPLVQIAGAAAIVSGVLIWAIFLHYKSLGIAGHYGAFAAWSAGTVLAAAAFYFVVRTVRARQGVNLAFVYREIPPE
jgi:APA family basic amino acid/polyamine antiporter